MANLIEHGRKAIIFVVKTISRDDENRTIVRFITGRHAHSDTGILLESLGQLIEGVRVDISHGLKPFPAIGLIYQGNFFAVARGMQHVTLRLPPDHADLLISYGALRDEEIGLPDWISFSPFALNVDMEVWVREAFIHSTS